MRKKVNFKFKSRSVVLAVVVGIVLVTAILACSLDFGDSIPGGNGEISIPPAYGSLTEGLVGDAAAEIGSVANGYTPTGSTAITNANKETLRTATTGNYYLAEDITDYAFNCNPSSGDAYFFQGSLDGNGHSITIRGGSYSYAKTGGGVFGAIGSAGSAGSVKNLKVIYNSSITITRTNNDSAYFGVGLLVGNLRNGTIENVKVTVNSGVSVELANNGNNSAIGGLIGHVGNKDSSAYAQTVNRCEVNLNGALKNTGSGWTVVGGIVGVMNSSKWCTDINFSATNVIMSGSGTFASTGSGKRISPLIGSYVGKSASSVTVNGFINALTNPAVYTNTAYDRASYAVIPGYENDTGGYGTVNVSYATISNTVLPASNLKSFGTVTNKGAITVSPTVSGVTFNGFSYDADGYITVMTTSTLTTYVDFIGKVNGTQNQILNNWKNYTKVNARICKFDALTTGGSAEIAVETPVAASNATQFLNALKQGRSVSVQANLDLGATAFEANIEYKGMILGNNKTVTFTGVSSSGYGDAKQGALVKTLNGASISDLTVEYTSSFTKSVAFSGDSYLGLIAGEICGGTVVTNLKVTINDGVTLTATQSSNMNLAVGGMFGLATGTASIDAAVVAIGTNAKITCGGGANSSWTWTGGLIGNVSGTGLNLKLTKIAVYGGGTMEGLSTGQTYSKRVAGVIGGIRQGTTGAIAMTDYVYALKTLSGNATARIACYDGGTPSFEVTGCYYLNADGVADFHNVGAGVTTSVASVTTVSPHPFDKSGAAMGGIDVSVTVNADFSKIVLNLPQIEFDVNYIWTIELKSGASIVLDTATLSKDASSYALSAPISYYASLGVYMKQSRSVTLPSDADVYEHGYVPSGYAQQQGYYSNDEWTEINNTVNGSMLADLSGSGKYFLTEDIEVAGFVSTHRFEGVFDGCGHTITLIDSGTRGQGLNGNLGGLFAELTGVVKNARVVVKTSVSSTAGVSRFGLLAGKMDSGAKLYNVKVSYPTGYTAQVSLADNSAITMGGVAGLVEGSDASPVEMLGVTMELNGELRATGQWSWMGGVVGRVGHSAAGASGTRKLIAKQMILRGDNGKLNNVDVAGTTTERTAGFAIVGGYGTNNVCTLDLDGFIFEFNGKIVGQTISLGSLGDSNVAVFQLKNVFRTTSVEMERVDETSGSYWYASYASGKATSTNESVVESAFTQNGKADNSLGYTVALFDPAAVNTADGTVNVTDSLVIAAIFEDGKENEFFVADIEIVYGSTSKTGTDAVSLINFFKLTPTSAFDKIVVQIRSSSASDGIAGVSGADYNAIANSYTDGWLTDNGRVPSTVGVPKGATAIDSNTALLKWLDGQKSDGTLIAQDDIAYLYGYLTSDFNGGATTLKDRPLAAGRTLDGLGKKIIVQTGSTAGYNATLANWMTGATANICAVGELVTVNYGTIKNLTIDVASARGYTEPTQGIVYGVFAAVNEGIIENCKTLVSSGKLQPIGRNASSGPVICGGIAGVNRGTIRYSTIENNSQIDVGTGIAQQKIAGGIAGVNDGGTMEYLVSQGSGIYTIAGSATYKAFLGGIVGYARISSNAPSMTVGASAKPKQGIIRNVLHNFAGSFQTSGTTTQGLYYGAIAGYAMPNAPGAVNAATGWFAAVKNGKSNMTYYFFQANGTAVTSATTLQYEGFSGGDTGIANTNYGGGGAINVTYDGTANSVAADGSHHFWWDYWGGTGELRYEVYKSASVSAMTATGTGASANAARGTAAIKNTATVSGTPAAYAITTSFYNDGSYYDFLNGIKNLGKAASVQTTSGTDLASGWYSGGISRLSGSGNFYLSADVTIDVMNLTGNTKTTFSGTFDGNGHTITITGDNNGAAFAMTRSKEAYGILTDVLSGTIKNVNIAYNMKLERIRAGGGSPWYFSTGIIAGESSGTIDNVSITMGAGAILIASLNNATDGNDNRLGVFCGNQTAGTIKNCSVDLGTSFTMKCLGTASGRYGGITYQTGLVGYQSSGTSVTNLLVKGTGSFYGQNASPKSTAFIGAIVGRAWGSLSNVYLDNMTVTLTQTNATTWADLAGDLTGNTSDGNSEGTVSNVYLIGTNRVISGTNTTPNPTPNQGVVSGTFFANSLDAMLSVFQNARNLSSQISNGVNAADATVGTRNLFLNFSDYKKSTFAAGYKLVLRYPELGYFISDLKSGSAALSTGNAESTYVIDNVGSDSKLPSDILVGIRAKVSLIYNKVDTNGNTVSEIASNNILEQDYTGSSATPYEFRAVPWGDGTTGTGSTVALSWGVGGKITSGRVPTEAAITAAMTFQNDAYAYQNAAANTMIARDKVQFSGSVNYKVLKIGLEVTSDTSGEDAKQAWKDRGLLTFRLTGATVDGAMNQVVYSLDGGISWKNVLKCNNYQNGSASVTVSFESQRGGSSILFRAYDGISQVSKDSEAVVVRVDTSAPVVGWEENSQKLSGNMTERILVVDDVSSVDLSKDDDVLTITCADGQHNLDYELLNPDWRESGKIRVFVKDGDAASAVSGKYVFTVKDALGRTASIEETLDFTPPTLDVSVTDVARANDYVAINNPETTAAINLSDNETSAENLVKTLKAYFLPKGETDVDKSIWTISVADGTILTGNFDIAKGTGSVTLSLPEQYYNGEVELWFEATDDAGNVKRVNAFTGQKVILDTQVYTVNVKKPTTDGNPYDTNGLSYRINGSQYTAVAGEGDVLNVLKAHLFDTIEIVYVKKDGYTYSGYDVMLGQNKLGTIPQGTQYTLGAYSAEDLSDNHARSVVFNATQELKIQISTAASGLGALPGGNYSDMLSDYVDAETGKSVFPNFLQPNASVFVYSAETKDYTDASKFEGKTLKDYFDITFTDPNGTAIGVRDVDGVETLTFVVDSADGNVFIEGSYTLQLALKESLKDRYTVLEGSTATFTVSARSRRNVEFTYPGDSLSFVYNGNQPLFDQDGNVFVGDGTFKPWTVEFAADAFNESAKTQADEDNLTALKNNLSKLNYTLYGSGGLIGQQIGGVTQGTLEVSDVGVYYLTVSIPITGENKFVGVTGTKQLTITVTKKTADVYATEQSVPYGDAIDPTAYYFDGLVSKDVKNDAGQQVSPNDVADGVLTSFPKVSTEYSAVRVVNGVVTAYANGAVLTGGIAKNYNFVLHSANLTVVPRDIILKITDSRKTYGASDPSFAYWGLSNTESWSDENGTHTNNGFGYSDNALAFFGSEFKREAGESAGVYANGVWTQNEYKISGILTNQNYNIRVEEGVFRIARRELSFSITGDQGLIYEEGIKHTISAKISNGITADKLTVAVVYVDGYDFIGIGTHYYKLVVSKDGQENSDQLFCNYTYNQANIPVVIGASVLNVVVLPQVLTYGAEPATGTDWYVLEGIKEEDRDSVSVKLNIPKEYQKVGYHAGAISAEVSFTSANVNYTPIIRKGNLTVLPQTVELNWSGDFNSVYTGDTLDRRITATVKTATADALQVSIAFSSDSGSATPQNAGNYTATASLTGSNSENYIVTAKDRTRQFIVQKSEQRISVSDNYTYNPETTEYPTFNAELAYAVEYNGEKVYRARIYYQQLLSVAVNTATGYRATTAKVPSITVYCLDSVSSVGVGTNALKKFTPGAADYFELEAGTYTAVAEIAGDGNHYSNTYFFTFVVRETQNKLNTAAVNGNKIDTKAIQGSFVANSLGETVKINDDTKLGYVVGPNTQQNNSFRNVVVQNGTVKRTMSTTLQGTKAGSGYNLQLADGYYGTHDGDWAYAYFNISVSEQLRELILQGKVQMKFDFTAGTQKGGMAWYKNFWGQWVVDSGSGAWREDGIDTTNLSYMVREISSANDLNADTADASWIGLNANPHDISSSMMKYGQTEGYSVLTNGLELLKAGELTLNDDGGYPYWNHNSSDGSTEDIKDTYSKNISLAQDNLRSGSAFRVYLVSSTIGSTRADKFIEGDVGVNEGKYLGNKRNNFMFENMQVTFVENTNSSPTISADKSAPTVSAALSQDESTKGMKYRFDIEDGGTGIDFSSVSATVGGNVLTPGNGLNLVVKDYMMKDKSPILSKAIFETGVISTSQDLGVFVVKDYAGNVYRSTPKITTDKTAPTLGDVRLSADGSFDTGQSTASETFWYNKKQYISVAVTDDSGQTPDVGIYRYDDNGNRQTVPSTHASGRITSTEALGTGLYYVYAEDGEGNLTVITFNLLVDESAEINTPEIVLDPNLTPPDGESEGSWQKGNVVIENTVTSFGDSFGRMYYATSDTDFRDSYQTNPNLQWFAMDVELRDGQLILSETITTATKKYYAFKYVAGAASYPGADDNVTVYKYYGLIMIDREEPSISAESYKVTEKTDNESNPANWEKAGLNSGEWTNNDIVFEISGTTGLSKGRLEYTLNGVKAEDSLWYRPGDAGYSIYYWDYESSAYTTTFDETRCYFANNAGKTSFDYKAYLLLSGQNTGNVYAFRFVNGAGSKIVSTLGVSDDGRDTGFKVAIDKIAPEVTSINSSWQPNETKSQIYIRETDSGVKSVTVYEQVTDADGNGIFADGVPQFKAEGYSAEKTNGRWYYTFKGVYYNIVVEDLAGNVGSKNVKLKIDTRDPVVTLENGSPSYSNRYVVDGTSADDQKLGEGVWAYRNADGEAFIEFRFVVTGGISGYTFAYSTVGFTSIENEWIKLGGTYDQPELDQESGGYTHSFTFRLEADRAETYLFRFTSGAQKSVYFNFADGKAEPYRAENEKNYNYRVNVDATPAEAAQFEYGKDSQWISLEQYDDSRWVTDAAVAIRFTAAERLVNHASTGLGRVTYQKDGGEETEITETNGYYRFLLTECKRYTVRVYDKAGNRTEYVVSEKKIDLVSPEIKVTATTESDSESESAAYTEGSATNRSVRLKYEFIFGDSGIASIQFGYGSKTYTKEELEAGVVIDSDFSGSVELRFTNGAGETYTKKYQVLVDKTNPTIEITGLPETDVTQPVVIRVTPTDENGSGIASATLSYEDNGQTVTVDVSQGYELTVKDWRTYTVTAKDNAGNVKETSFSAKVDATVPENFEMKATTSPNDTEYVSNVWSTSAVTLTFTVTFQTVAGATKYGNIEYRADDGEWKILFYAGDENYRANGSNNTFRYVMDGEVNGKYEFRAKTLSGNVSEKTVTIEKLLIDTVTPALTAKGLIGGEGGMEFVPNTEKGYTWISEDVEVTFEYVLGLSGGAIYLEKKTSDSGEYARTVLFDNLSKSDAKTPLKYTIQEEGYYRFALKSNADANGDIEAKVDYGKIQRDETAPTISVASYQRINDMLAPYTPAGWTKNSVVIVIDVTLGVSYKDSALFFSTGDSVQNFNAVETYEAAKENAELNADGLYSVVCSIELTNNQMLNYDFRIESGAGVARYEELRRSGGAVRIDKNAPQLTVESVAANGTDYATFDGTEWEFVGNGWTNQNVTFTFKVRTYLSGGTLKYTYQELAGYTSDNIASYGSPTSGADENGNAYTERRYTLTLSGEEFAINAELLFRVESGSGIFSNDETDAAKKVTVKIDKAKPTVNENSVQKTPNVSANTFTAQDVQITFEVYDLLVSGIASGVKSVAFGKMSGSTFVQIGELLTAKDGRYCVTVSDNASYIIRVTDEAGNYSDRVVLENVDKTQPVLSVNTEYNAGDLSTKPIEFNFKGSSFGVSGAKAQYRLGTDGTWQDAADANGTFTFNETKFEGTLYFRLLSGAGVASETVEKSVRQDLTDYTVTVTESVVVNGNFSGSINFVKNGNGTSVAPKMKKGETLTLQITEKAEYPLYQVYVNDQMVQFSDENGKKVFAITANGDTNVVLHFREIVSVTFETEKLNQSIRVTDGKNAEVTAPFRITGEHPGFGFEATYLRVKDEYGKEVLNEEGSKEVPQKLGTYRIDFKVTGEHTALYEFSSESKDRALVVYYFDKISAANVTYYEVSSAYDLRYIRYSLEDGVEFRQTRDLTVTSEVAAANGGDWTVGTLSSEAIYNGANYKITVARMETAAKPLFGEISSGARVENVGLVLNNPILNVADNGVYAAFASSVSGTLRNVYVTGSARIAGKNASAAGVVGTIDNGGTLEKAFSGLKLDVTAVTGTDAVAAGIVRVNNGSVKTVFSAGSVVGKENFTSGHMVAYEGSGTFSSAATIGSTLYSGTNVLDSAPKDGVEVVKYWDLNDVKKPYWDTAILAETLSPKAEQVNLKTLVDDALNGLTFETDESNNRYVPVSTFEHLMMMNDFLWADYRQTADIDVKGKALSIASDVPFTGSYDGKGFVIANVSSGSADGGYGLFGYVTGTIQNVVLKELNVDASAMQVEEAVVGGLVQYLVGGVLTNVSVGGSVKAGVPNGTLVVGGVVGKASNGAKISQILNTVSVTTEKETKLLYAGSIVGILSESTIENVYSIAKVDAYYTKRAAVGQLIGMIENAGKQASADRGYSVVGVTYVNGAGKDAVVGYDPDGAAKENFEFITFSDMMNADRHYNFTVNGKHVSITLKTLFPFERGTGVESDPFEITTAEEFRLIGNYLYAHYKIMNDIDFKGNFETVGVGMKFTGSIIGVNSWNETVRKLSGLTGALVDRNYGRIQGLELKTAVKGNMPDDTVFGAAANENYGTVSFVKANGSIELNGLSTAALVVGGLVGKNYGVVEYSNSNFKAKFGTVNLKFGGVAGVSKGGTIYKNVVEGTVKATVLTGTIGMLVGMLDDPACITRQTNTSGDCVDVFLQITVNKNAVDASNLSGFDAG